MIQHNQDRQIEEVQVPLSELRRRIKETSKKISRREDFMKECIDKLKAEGFDVDEKSAREKVIMDMVLVKQRLELDMQKMMSEAEKETMMEDIIIASVKLYSTLYDKKFFKG